MFRHQEPLLGRFIADFLAPVERLVIEVDGAHHAEQARADARAQSHPEASAANRCQYEFWKKVVVQSGPTGLRSFKGMHDEALAGKLKGLRSSRLSKGYRVIYRFDKTAVYVQVLEINAHDYRR